MQGRPYTEQVASPNLPKNLSLFRIFLPEEVANHFREQARNPSQIAKEMFDKYLVASTGYRYCIMKTLFVTYRQLNYVIKRHNEEEMKMINDFNQAIALVVTKHMTVIENNGVTFTYVTDLCYVKIVEGWMGMFDIVGADYSHFRTGKLKKIGDTLFKLYFLLNMEIQRGKYPDTGLQIPSPEEYHDFMGAEKFLKKEDLDNLDY